MNGRESVCSQSKGFIPILVVFFHFRYNCWECSATKFILFLSREDSRISPTNTLYGQDEPSQVWVKFQKGHGLLSKPQNVLSEACGWGVTSARAGCGFGESGSPRRRFLPLPWVFKKCLENIIVNRNSFTRQPLGRCPFLCLSFLPPTHLSPTLASPSFLSSFVHYKF